MAVRIVDNFWDNYKNNEDIIIRCFKHHFHRHPDPDGECQSYNNLLVRLHELKIFERFDLNKLVEAADKAGIIHKEELPGYSEGNLTEETLNKAGINVGKKWEQFLYKWIEQVVCAEYTKRGKYYKRFCNYEESVDYGIPKDDVNHWIATAEEAEAYDKKYTSYKEDDRRGRKIPPSFTNRYVAGEEGFDDPCEAYSAEDLRGAINKKLSDIEQEVLTLLEQGYTEKEISIVLGYSQQYINKKIHTIRSVTASMCRA